MNSKRCAANDCFHSPRNRSKYCEIHRGTRKRQRPNPVAEIPPPAPIPEIDYDLLEERNLRAQQEEDYEMTMEMDRMFLREKEQKQIEEALRQSKIIEDIERKRQNITEDGEYNVKFVFSNGYRVQTRLSGMNNAYDFVDVFIHDNGMTLSNYEIVYYPNVRVPRESCLSDLKLQMKSCVFNVHDLDK